MEDDNNAKYIIAIFITKQILQEKEVMIVREYIENHWKERFDIDKIAHEANLSSSHLSAYLKAYWHYTHDYYINIKVSKIKEMLLNTDLTISEACLWCGLSWVLCQAFQEKTGFTPTEYRGLVNLEQR